MPSHPLLVVSYPKIAAGDVDEINKLYKASTQLGFFYLEGHGLNPEPILRVAQDTFNQPLSEKEPFKRGSEDAPFGYKMPNSHGVEFICVAADDARAYPERVYRSYPTQTEKGLASGAYKTYVEAADKGKLLLLLYSCVNTRTQQRRALLLLQWPRPFSPFSTINLACQKELY